MIGIQSETCRIEGNFKAHRHLDPSVFVFSLLMDIYFFWIMLFLGFLFLHKSFIIGKTILG